MQKGEANVLLILTSVPWNLFLLISRMRRVSEMKRGNVPIKSLEVTSKISRKGRSNEIIENCYVRIQPFIVFIKKTDTSEILACHRFWDFTLKLIKGQVNCSQ